jgi:DNA-binding response OmpR family regulator
MPKTTILVVDDDEYVRQLLQRILEGAGYSVVTAANGRDGLDKLPDSDASLVLLDIRMPELDGVGTLEGIRKQSDIPVIMITGVREATMVRDTLGLGANDYVVKPFQTGELLARIKVKLKRSKI